MIISSCTRQYLQPRTRRLRTPAAKSKRPTSARRISVARAQKHLIHDIAPIYISIRHVHGRARCGLARGLTDHAALAWAATKSERQPSAPPHADSHTHAWFTIMSTDISRSCHWTADTGALGPKRGGGTCHQVSPVVPEPLIQTTPTITKHCRSRPIQPACHTFSSSIPIPLEYLSRSVRAVNSASYDRMRELSTVPCSRHIVRRLPPSSLPAPRSASPISLSPAPQG